ncbi:ArsR/SmtB family transcription factor [Goodfellowiella coeruleoviolacea]|uniref:Helix-turn-helix domain-containing protein n=1 Tax=Goodfellowiella coeruleoviolacea TaxID=334858 RepID=A0AAE3KF82_9PSEU|nr:winged helix-turn-helix domain-containing protein [Goodfellowiella coeruleoviolacea]MCP2164660.1 Helix-turn-helix domain-containing protein [Goodfellowiella coeruleoviolacea]
MPPHQENISDPKKLRALSHPLRWKLIDLLQIEGTATATRCAELTGESVASCSYHLNMLAKYGFVEPAPSEGREKPWRLPAQEFGWSKMDLDDEGRLAAEAASDALIDHEMAEYRAAIRRKDREPEQWQRVTGSMSGLVYLTPEEATRLKNEFGALLDRYHNRVADSALRPEGARPVRTFASFWLTSNDSPRS